MKNPIVVEINRQRKALSKQLRTLDAIAGKLGGTVVRRKRKARTAKVDKAEAAPVTRGVRKKTAAPDAELAAKQKRLAELRDKRKKASAGKKLKEPVEAAS